MSIPLISGIVGIVDKFIVDKDKYAELQNKKIEMENSYKVALLNKTTTPKTDAFVKLLLAFKDIILPLFRPVGSLLLGAVVLYFHSVGNPLPPELALLLGGAFPGWMASRHVAKKEEEKTKRVKEEEDWDYYVEGED